LITPYKASSTVLGGLDDQSLVAMVPVGGFLVLGVAVGMDLLSRRLGIEIQIEGIFGDPPFEARAGPR
jgi:hypothetical protein